jgi:threonine-phosphate decarboxylase
MNSNNSTDSMGSVYDYSEQKSVSTRQILDFTLLTNPLGPSEKAKHAMRKAIREIGAPPDAEARYLRRYIARKEHIEPQSILFGNGSTQLLELLIVATKPRKVIVPDPSPSPYDRLLAGHGVESVPVAFACGDDCSVDTESVAARFPRAEMILVSNPHRLTGGTIPISALLDWVEKLEGSDKLLVIDETLIEYTEAVSPVERAALSNNLVILRSFSSFHCLAGLPLGYLIANPRVVTAMRSTLEPGPVSNVACAGALASLRDSGYRKRTAAYLKAEKTYIEDKLRGLDGVQVVDTACNFILLEFDEIAPELEAQLFRRNILIERFVQGGGRVCFRMPMRRHRENARFAKTILRFVRQGNASVNSSLPREIGTLEESPD